jgi:polysaccharide export outer membrane protein
MDYFKKFMNLAIFRIKIYFPVCVSLMFITACVNTRKATYFNDLTDTTIPFNLPIPETVIQKNDLLSIKISDLNPEASALFNLSGTSTGSNNQPQNNSMVIAANNATEYLVNNDGIIQIPLLGNIEAAGQTKDQLKASITKKLVDRKLLVDPVVSIRFLNFRITVLGEVKNPSVITVPNEKISLLEALGMAGDLTVYGQKENVLVIREENGNKVVKRINLRSNELLSSPYYFLKSNDIIYVSPNKARVASIGRGQQWIPIIFSALSFGVIVLDRVIK